MFIKIPDINKEKSIKAIMCLPHGSAAQNCVTFPSLLLDQQHMLFFR